MATLRTYLGDGVYARVDDGYIWLYTSDGIDKTPEIAIELEVFQRLAALARQVWGGQAE